MSSSKLVGASHCIVFSVIYVLLWHIAFNKLTLESSILIENCFVDKRYGPCVAEINAFFLFLHPLVYAAITIIGPLSTYFVILIMAILISSNKKVYTLYLAGKVWPYYFKHFIAYIIFFIIMLACLTPYNMNKNYFGGTILMRSADFGWVFRISGDYRLLIAYILTIAIIVYMKLKNNTSRHSEAGTGPGVGE